MHHLEIFMFMRERYFLVTFFCANFSAPAPQCFCSRLSRSNKFKARGRDSFCDAPRKYRSCPSFQRGQPWTPTLFGDGEDGRIAIPLPGERKRPASAWRPPGDCHGRCPGILWDLSTETFGAGAKQRAHRIILETPYWQKNSVCSKFSPIAIKWQDVGNRARDGGARGLDMVSRG